MNAIHERKCGRRFAPVVLRNMPVGGKLFSILGLSAAALLTVGAVAAFTLVSVGNEWQNYLDVVQAKQNHLKTMRAEMGYGGAIHSLKNYVLRGQENDFETHNSKADGIVASANAYRSTGDLTPVELKSLQKIEEMVERYRAAIWTARRLMRKGKSAQEIDRSIKIDDGPYLQALATLSRQLEEQTKARTESLTKTIQRTLWAITLVIPTSMALLAFFGFLLSRAITGPLRQSVVVLEQVAAGDLTQRLEIDSQDEIGRMAAALNTAVAASAEMLDQVNQGKQAADVANRAKSEFLANMSHEIRTPMTAIVGYAEQLLIEEGIDDAPSERKEAFETILRNGRQLLQLINDILDLSKIESGKLQVERIDCVPWDIVADTVSTMRGRAKEKGLRLSVVAHGKLPRTIRTDPTRLGQILTNLVGNALKFTAHGQVQVVVQLDTETQRGTSLLRFDVVDTGIGIAPEQLERIFEPFSQADASTTRKFGGTGLGLTIVQRLVESLGGTITVQSDLGSGSTFTATVETGSLSGVEMVDVSSTPAEITAETVNAKVADPAPTLSGRVLLAEDGLDNQRLIALILRKAGCEVTLADDGRAANDLAMAALDEGNPFDVILMDMQMPVLDGYEATAKLRAAGYDRPIVALTAHAMAGDREKCIEAGCDEYTTKPIDRVGLISLVASQMERGKEKKTLV